MFPCQAARLLQIESVPFRMKILDIPQSGKKGLDVSMGQNTVVRASAPQSAGREVCNDFRVLGTCPAPADGVSDITALYTGRYGVPAAGTKVFVRCNQMVDGFEDLPQEFVGIVPQAA